MKYSSLIWKLPLGVLLCLGCYSVVLITKYGPAWCDHIVAREADKTRADLRAEMALTRGEVLAEVRDSRAQILDKLSDKVDATRADSLAALAAIAAKADNRIDDIAGKLDAQVTATRGELKPILADVQHITSAASEQADLLGRCVTEIDGEFIGNQDCLANRLIPAMKNFEHMAAAGEKVFQSVEKETPATAKAVREGAQQMSGIATDAHTFTSAAVAPVPWYRKLGSMAYAVARLVLLAK